MDETNMETVRSILNMIQNDEMMRKWCLDLQRVAFREYSDRIPSRKYRGGIGTTSYNYLLLDPTIIGDLTRERILTEPGRTLFLKSIFYIGKGTSTRADDHFKDTRRYLEGDEKIKLSERMQTILSLWDNHGVPNFVLFIFRYRTHEEDHTREALMMNALCPCNLTNGKTVNYYGFTRNDMGRGSKKLLGAFLLYEALRAFEFNHTTRVYAANYPLRPNRVQRNRNRRNGRQ